MHKNPRRHDAAGGPYRPLAFQAQQEGCVFTQGELRLCRSCIALRVQGEVVGHRDILGDGALLLHGDEVLVAHVWMITQLSIHPRTSGPGGM